MTKGKWLLPLLAILTVLIPCMVSADTITVDGVTIEFDPEDREAVERALELFGPPPAPPSMPIIEVAAVTSSNPDDGGTSIADMDMEVDIAEYNAGHEWLDSLPY